MSKNILFGDEARLKMFAGMEKVAKTVVSTMGPKGRNVIFSIISVVRLIIFYKK